MTTSGAPLLQGMSTPLMPCSRLLGAVDDPRLCRAFGCIQAARRA